MKNIINSPIFGETSLPSDQEREIIKGLIAEFPVSVFQELNKKFNEIGMCILIDARHAVEIEGEK